MKVGLFVPCYVDALYPEVGVATYKLLKSLGVDVEYPEKQTCCGQPMGNAGFQNKAEHLVENYDELFKAYDYVVAPSASCAAYVRVFHPNIVNHECHAAEKTMDIVEFLHDVLKVTAIPGAKFPHKVSLHNSCHGVRELGLSSPTERSVPRFNKIKDLLQLVEGIEVMEPERADECCGFGGMFAIEEPDVSARMGKDKLARHIATGAEFITGPDSSCLMHMQGLVKKGKGDYTSKAGKPIEFIHVVQILASGL
ncbi:MAG: (Fe-S)-binding protein [Bacteroidales bacterium]|nr:(Fe-S)-binding protein [Bacteroidales bacterium]